MGIEAYDGVVPQLDPSVYVAASADIIGRVTIGAESSVWYHATLRGDINSIQIGARSNIQDNVVVHLADDFPCIIGNLVTIGHAAVVHACEIHDEVLVGMGAIILDGAVIGARSIVGAGALVTSNTHVPPGSLVLGSPARVVRTLSEPEQNDIRHWADKYVGLAARYRSRT